MSQAKPNEPRGVMARYALILETVAASSAGLSLTEIMRGTGLSSGTTHRLLNTLLDVFYLTDQGGRKIYRIGPRLIRLFHLAQSPTSVSLLVQPVLQGLVARFGETAFVAKLSGDQVEIGGLRRARNLQPVPRPAGPRHADQRRGIRQGHFRLPARAGHCQGAGSTAARIYRPDHHRPGQAAPEISRRSARRATPCARTNWIPAC